MKCDVLVGNKLGSIPLVECGGAVLGQSDEVIVTPELSARMQAHYGPRIVKAGEVEKTLLASGQYEVNRKGASAYSTDPKSKVVGGSAALEGHVADKSMLNKKTKTKTKSAE